MRPSRLFTALLLALAPLGAAAGPVVNDAEQVFDRPFWLRSSNGDYLGVESVNGEAALVAQVTRAPQRFHFHCSGDSGPIGIVGLRYSPDGSEILSYRRGFVTVGSTGALAIQEQTPRGISTGDPRYWWVLKILRHEATDSTC